MIVTLFLLPALGLIPVSLGAVVPHQLSSKYASGVEKHVMLDPRNRPPADFVPEDTPHAVNLAATDGPGQTGGGEGDEECDDDQDEQSPLPAPAKVNLAATDGYVQTGSGKGDEPNTALPEVNLAANDGYVQTGSGQGDEECDDDGDDKNTAPPEVNLAATDGPANPEAGEGDEECDDDENEQNTTPPEVNLAATDGPANPGDQEGDEECEDDESQGPPAEVNLAATDGPPEDDEECDDDQSDDSSAEMNLAASGSSTEGAPAGGSNIAVEQPIGNGSAAVSVPVINLPSPGDSSGEDNHQASPTPDSPAASGSPNNDIPVELNNVAVGQGRTGGGTDVGVPAGNPQPDSAPHDQPKPQDGAPGSNKPEEVKPKDDQPKDGQPKDDAKPESGNDNTSINTDGDVHVGTGWDISKNKADLSTWIDNGLQWFYQWTLEPTFKDVKAEFIPMVWGPDHVPKVKDAMSKWPENVKHVLSFNEPDIKKGQAGQYLKDTKQAAELHNQVSDTLGDKYQFSTPAVATGPDWLEEWEKECIGLIGKPCRSDFIAYHYYGKKPEELIDTIKKLHERFGKKVWMTEYGCYDFVEEESCSIEEADNLMKTTVEWFRANPDIVERWAWFGAFGDMKNWQGLYDMDSNRIANPDGTVSDKGKKYLSM